MTPPDPVSRRQFVQTTALAAAAVAAKPLDLLAADKPAVRSLHPRAITMWDFSWIERRWSGGGYEEWPAVLDELVERGYDAVRIDAFPHLVANGAEKRWKLLPVWYVQDWGSPSVNVVQIQPGLNTFISLCRERGIRVGLSSWYREDADNLRMRITSAGIMAEQWIRTLDQIRQAGLLDAILYVDLCNEWPGDIWAPFFRNSPPQPTWGAWHTDASMDWMRRSCEAVRSAFPELPVGYSFHIYDEAPFKERDVRFLDYLEPHIWMASANGGEYYNQVGYKYDRFTFDSYIALVEKGEALYRSKPGYWQAVLVREIEKIARISRAGGFPLMTTESWGLVDFKDGPLMHWDWVKELCRLGVETSAATGRWLAIATSNFSGPQFRGMWRDVAWHREATGLIRKAAIHPELQATKLAARL